MWRSLTAVALAIQLSNPLVHRQTATAWAKTIREEAGQRHIDPFTFVAIITHETNWHPALTGNKKDPMVGLGQIRARNYPACQESLSSAACVHQIQLLQNGSYNIRQMGSIITRTRKFCRRWKGTKNAWFAEWLSQYQGFGRTGQFCLWAKRGHHKRRLATPSMTRDVMRYRRCVLHAVARHEKPNPHKMFSCWRIYRSK